MEEPISMSTNFPTRVTEDRRRRRKDHLDSKNSSRRHSFKLSYKKMKEEKEEEGTFEFFSNRMAKEDLRLMDPLGGSPGGRV